MLSARFQFKIVVFKFVMQLILVWKRMSASESAHTPMVLSLATPN